MSTNYIRTFFDLVFPKIAFSKANSTFASFGWKIIPESGVSVWVAKNYQDPEILNLIEHVKVRKEFSYSEELIQIFAKSILNEPEVSSVQKNKVLIVPAPSDPKRLLIDGFNLTLVLAKGLAKKLKLDTAEIITKSKHTQKQSYLKKEERLLNNKGVFKIVEVVNVAKYDEIWIIDDLTTTGATLAECQKEIIAKYPFVKVKLLALASN
jgi:ComF family protein